MRRFRTHSTVPVPAPVDAAAMQAVRRGLATLDPSASTSLTGEDRARLEEIFAPRHHGNALDPSTTLVLGARGAGKSFWASVLNQDDTRELAAILYPRLGLDRLRVAVGFSGVEGEAVTREVIDAYVPQGEEETAGRRLWRAAVARHALHIRGEGERPLRIRSLMERLADPEDWQDVMADADATLKARGERLLILFDALDALALDWTRLRGLTDSLMAVAWSLRGYSAIRAKLFIRPDQLDELNLRFVELSKLRAGAAHLDWEQADLFGMMFARLAFHEEAEVVQGFLGLLSELSLPAPPAGREGLQDWALSHDRQAQKKLFERMAGLYMGAGPRKGRTYDWPTNHLADGLGEVTPRSFLILMRRATSRVGVDDANSRVMTPEGIRDGLRAASRVRIDQLASEYPWIGRVLLPLAGLRVPNTPAQFVKRWRESRTIEAVRRMAEERHFLPPIPEESFGLENRASRAEAALAERLVGMGVMSVREDGRYDMPDLFRIGALLLRKGGVAPQ